MRNFPKPTDSVGGIQKYWFVPVNDVAALGDIILNELQSITFETDKNWLTGYGVYDSKTFREDKKENKSGIRFLRSLKIFYPGFDLAAVQQFLEMQITQFLVAYKDFNGTYKIAGTLDNPLNFKYQLATGKSGSNAQGYDIEFFADSKIRISETINPDAITYDDWFLPSEDELNAMYTNLHLFGVGGFSELSGYWSSTEANVNSGRFLTMIDGIWSVTAKNGTGKVRASRSFEGNIGEYSLRDTGPAGGLIFYINGTTFYESSPLDLDDSVWSNIIGILAGATGTAIGTGQANTTAIINQAGHTTSAAKLCDDLSVTN